MKIYSSLKLKETEIISFVGGGGKTTTIFKLAEELKGMGKRLLITTTTAIFNPKREEYDYYFLKDIDSAFKPSNGSVTILGYKVESGKLLGGSVCHLEEIIARKLFDYVLIEADGAKRKPIKALASHEPIIPKQTSKTIGIIGLDCLDEKIIDIVHRPENFTKLTCKAIEDLVFEGDIIKLVLHNKGLFKGAMGERVLILNKAENHELILRAKLIRKELAKNAFNGVVIIGSILKKKFY